MKISSIDLKNKIATTFDMQTGLAGYEVTNMYDDDGDETEDCDAVVVVIIKENDTKWHVVDIRDFPKISAS